MAWQGRCRPRGRRHRGVDRDNGPPDVDPHRRGSRLACPCCRSGGRRRLAGRAIEPRRAGQIDGRSAPASAGTDIPTASPVVRGVRDIGVAAVDDGLVQKFLASPSLFRANWPVPRTRISVFDLLSVRASRLKRTIRPRPPSRVVICSLTARCARSIDRSPEFCDPLRPLPGMTPATRIKTVTNIRRFTRVRAPKSFMMSSR